MGLTFLTVTSFLKAQFIRERLLVPPVINNILSCLPSTRRTPCSQNLLNVKEVTRMLPSIVLLMGILLTLIHHGEVLLIYGMTRMGRQYHPKDMLKIMAAPWIIWSKEGGLERKKQLTIKYMNRLILQFLQSYQLGLTHLHLPHHNKDLNPKKAIIFACIERIKY